MSIHFHRLPVKSLKKETADCVSICFDVPASLKQDFNFVQGQNLTLRATINGEDIRRSYSICSAPFENELTVAVKKVEGGKFSTWANEELKQGDILEVMTPAGKFNTALDAGNRKNYLAFAAGSGITPIISIIKTTLQTEPNSAFTLVFVNKNKSSIIFFEELEALKNKYLQRFNLINLLTREKADADVFYGRLDAEKLEQLNKLIDYKKQDEFFVCGPEQMIFCVKDFLETLGADAAHIHFELFTSNNSVTASKEKISATAVSSTIQVIADGRSMEFPMHNSSNSILDEALKNGADLPFACKGGMCCTCKAKLLEGQVKMDVTWGLEADEIEKGYILTCQAHPLTEKVVVDFDDR